MHSPLTQEEELSPLSLDEGAMASPEPEGGSVHGQMLPKRIPAWRPGQEDTAFRCAAHLPLSAAGIVAVRVHD